MLEQVSLGSFKFCEYLFFPAFDAVFFPEYLGKTPESSNCSWLALSRFYERVRIDMSSLLVRPSSKHTLVIVSLFALLDSSAKFNPVFQNIDESHC